MIKAKNERLDGPSPEGCEFFHHPSLGCFVLLRDQRTIILHYEITAGNGMLCIKAIRTPLDMAGLGLGKYLIQYVFHYAETQQLKLFSRNPSIQLIINSCG